MKQRESVGSADFNQNVEAGYEKSARNIAFRAGGALIVRDGQVLFSANGLEEPLMQVRQPKRLWRDLFDAMKDRFPELWP